MTTARDSSRHLLNIINDILDLSEFEAGQVELEQVDFDLPRLVHSIIQTFMVQAQNQGLELNLHLADGIPRYPKGDPIRLRQIQVNLLNPATRLPLNWKSRWAAII